jgi:uncharacterized protein (TIGR00369 family)
MTASERTRTVTWQDPHGLAERARTLSGLEFLRTAADGVAPPIASTLGFEFAAVDEGRVEFTLQPAEYHYNPIGSVHGSVYAALLDSACGCAVHSMLPAGTGYTSLDLTIKFLRAIRVDTGVVRCVGTVRHLGRRTALAEASIVDAQDTLYATATSSCVILGP